MNTTDKQAETAPTAASDTKATPAAASGTDSKIAVASDATSASTPAGTQSKQTKSRWDPFETRDELHNDMMRMWGHVFGLTPHPVTLPRHRLILAPRTWAPSTDVYEQDGNLVVKAELPGLKKEDIHVSLDQGSLVIRGEHTDEQEVKEQHFFRKERAYGSFYRRIPLSPEVKADQITANYVHGVLEVHVPLPVQGQTGGHTIAVN
jgi:HSP20 family protein